MALEETEEASCLHCADFIRSIKGTVEKFTFDHRQLVLPVIVSGRWPCLAILKLRDAAGLGGKAALKMELRAVLGERLKIALDEWEETKEF